MRLNQIIVIFMKKLNF